MTSDPRLLELVQRWEQLRAQGQHVTAEELCQDCPELLPALRQAVGPPLNPTTRLEATPSSPPVEDSAPSGWTLPSGRYQPRRFHARGGQGEVYVGDDTELNREVALKRIQQRFGDSDNVRRLFLREAEITARLQHPGIVPIYGLVHDDTGQPCYAMRFVEGEPLRDALEHFHAADRKGRDPGPRHLEFVQLLLRFVAVCKTLAYAHSRGVVHLDLKPGNILLGKFGETFVVDWGLARPFLHGEGERSGSEEMLPAEVGGGEVSSPMGQQRGTPPYMSPEQAAGRWDLIGPASDVYGLGATLYHLLTGRLPFTGNVLEIFQKVQRGDFPRPRHVKRTVPRPLEAICLKAMALRPEDRYATVQALAADLERWLGDEPVEASPEPLLLRLRRWARRHRSAVVVGAVLLLSGLALGGGWLWWRSARMAATVALVEPHLQRAQERRQQAQGVAFEEFVRWKDALGLWHEALDEAEQAKAILDQGIAAGVLRERVEEVLATLQGEVQEARRDRRLVEDIEGIRGRELGFTEGQEEENLADRYAAAFARYGIQVGVEDPGDVGRRIARRAIREELLSTLDDWFAWETDAGRGKWLAEVLQAVEPNPDSFNGWVRAATTRNHLHALVCAATGKEFSPSTLVNLARRLYRAGVPNEAVSLLVAAQDHYPGDFWVAIYLSSFLEERRPRRLAEELRFATAAVAIRPRSAIARYNLGVVFGEQRRWAEAAVAYRKAIDLKPDYAEAHNNLGNVLGMQQKVDEAVEAYRQAIHHKHDYATAYNGLGTALSTQGKLDEAATALHKAVALKSDYAIAYNSLGSVLQAQRKLDEAIAAYRKAIARQQKYGEAYYNLGNALREQWRLEEAVEAYRKAADLLPKEAKPYNNLGIALKDQRRLGEAVEAYRQAIALEPDHPEAHYNLGAALKAGGQFGEALATFRKAQGLFAKQMSPHTRLVARLVRECETLAALEGRLPAFLRGEFRPGDNGERLRLALVCQHRKLHATAARLYAEALAADPTSAADLEVGHRYNAARAAAAGSASDRKADAAGLRRQALEWLRADLALWAKRLESGKAEDRNRVRGTLRHWQRDPDLTGLREPKALKPLPADEQQACQKLWAAVEALLQKAAGKVP